MQFPNQLSLMLQSLNVDVAKSGESLSVPRVSEVLESCSGCPDVQKCRSWLRGDDNAPHYRAFCINAKWLDTLPRLGPPTKVILDMPQAIVGKQAETGITPLQQQFLEQLRMSGDIAMMTDDKTTILWRTVDECQKKGWVSLKEISTSVSQLHLITAPS
jgi:hypothetical protein